jgi:hypothetical protein
MQNISPLTSSLTGQRKGSFSASFMLSSTCHRSTMTRTSEPAGRIGAARPCSPRSRRSGSTQRYLNPSRRRGTCCESSKCYGTTPHGRCSSAGLRISLSSPLPANSRDSPRTCRSRTAYQAAGRRARIVPGDTRRCTVCRRARTMRAR